MPDNIQHHIPADSGLESAPDYTAADWQQARDRLATRFGITDDKAAAELAASWKADNDIQKAKWDAQVAEDLQN